MKIKELDNKYIIAQFNTLDNSFNLGVNFCSQTIEEYDNLNDFNVKTIGREFYILISLVFCQISIGFKIYKR